MPSVVAVHRSEQHGFSKGGVPSIELVAGIGVAGDAHAGARVKHRSRVAADPTKPNLRQVHLINSELFGLVAERGFSVAPGDLGENITTSGIDLVDLPVGTVLGLGSDALIGLTGLRNPCGQIDRFQRGLLAEVLKPTDTGQTLRLAGVMAVVLRGGTVDAGDEIRISRPPEPHHRLERV